MSTESWRQAFAGSRSQVPVVVTANRGCRGDRCLNPTEPGEHYCPGCRPVTPFER